MQFDTPDAPIKAEIKKLIVAGWTGRDQAGVQHHIEELAAIGVPRPSATPLFYAASPDLLTQAEEITVLGEETSGEAEPFLLNHGGRLWLGLASDHTDRGLEAHSVAHSKQICAKPVASRLIPFDPAQAEEYGLACWIDEGAGWTEYQRGRVSAIMPLEELLAQCPMADGEAMLCGTLPAIGGGVRPGRAFRMELTPAAGDAITLAYSVAALPIIA